MRQGPGRAQRIAYLGDAPPALREAARSKFEQIKAGEPGESDGSTELPLQRPDGSVVPIEFRSARLSVGGHEYLQSISRDITERKLAETALARVNRALRDAQRRQRRARARHR